MSRKLPRGRSRAGRERGAVTAEFAIALPAVVLMICVVAATGAVAWTQLQCVDAASAAARLAARGESPSRVVGVARELAPAGAEVSVAPAGEGSGVDDVTVSVRTTLGLPLPGTPRLGVVGSATTPREPTDAGP